MAVIGSGLERNNGKRTLSKHCFVFNSLLHEVFELFVCYNNMFSLAVL